ncbi:uncharacterized protein LOC123300574 isoform X2 [Chrysoperla carnea]|uniref:uncharacterized protein LOC123300574 isoform X2 n=1 Tax=Chrysoperla carnea TaxID=189513 RepID=UPI001D0974DF|nr:uncharacterized protein LOC123300574 isoform X2 [Chrysoperla carnea]
MSNSPSDDGNAFFLFLIILFAFCLLLWNICSSRGENENNEEDMYRRECAIREQRMRVMTIQNVAFTCDPLNDYPRPLRQTYPDRYGSQPPMYDEGVFPSDSIGILEIPPPTYEEALRAALVHSNNNRNETTSPTTINISNDNNSTSSS